MFTLFDLVLCWILGTLAFFAIAVTLVQPRPRSWGKAVERFLLACAWPVVLVFLACWMVVVVVYTIVKRQSRRR